MTSPDFVASPPKRSLLQYSVDQALTNDAGQIGLATVAVDVFDRGPVFYPEHDPIVDIHTDGLRRALARYYRTAGRNAPLRIDIPRGTYVPTFSYNESPSGE